MTTKLSRATFVRLALYVGLLTAVAAALTARFRWEHTRRAEAHDRRGMEAFHRGDLSTAAVELRREIALSPDRALAYYKLGIIELQRGQPQKAREALRRAILKGVDQPHAPCALGLAAFRMSDYSAAVGPLLRCIAGNPEDDDARYLLATSYLGQARLDEAERGFKELLQKHPLDRRLLASLGSVYLYRASTPANDAAALATLRQAAALPGAPAGAFYSLGLVCRRAARWQEAAAALEEALRRDPQMLEARQVLGLVYRRLGKEKQASEQFRLARLQTASAQLDRRLSYLRGEAERSPMNPMVHVQLGCLEEQLKNDPGARAEFEAAAALDPHLPDPHEHLARLDERHGNTREAQQQRAMADRMRGGGDPPPAIATLGR